MLEGQKFRLPDADPIFLVVKPESITSASSFSFRISHVPGQFDDTVLVKTEEQKIVDSFNAKVVEKAQSMQEMVWIVIQLVFVFVVTVTILSTLIVSVVLTLRFCRPNKEKTQVMYVNEAQMEAMAD